MKLVLINHPGKEQNAMSLLLDAAQKIKIPTITVNSTQSITKLNKNEEYLLYRLSVDNLSLEARLYREFNITSFVQDYPPQPLPSSVFKRIGLNVPKTFHFISETLYEEVIATINFPLIIKIIGGYLGVGVIRIDNKTHFYHVLNLIKASGDKFIVQEYIKHQKQARLIVLGDRVIGSIENTSHHGDFRTNREHQSTSVAKIFPEHIQHMAVQGTRALGYEFAGVDIIFDEKNKPYILEANFPCYFPNTQKTANVPIAELMIKHLIAKCEKNRVTLPVQQDKEQRCRDLLLVSHPEYNQIQTRIIEKAADRFNLKVTKVYSKYDLIALSKEDSFLLLRNPGAPQELEIEIFNDFHCHAVAGNYASQQSRGYTQYQTLHQAHIPVPKRAQFKARDIASLKQAMIELNGPPYLLKTNFNSAYPDHIKLDTFAAFISLYDYLVSRKKFFVVQEYLPIEEYAYAVVIGDTVVASVQRFFENKERLYNDREQTIVPKQYDEATHAIAINAVKCLNLQAGLVYLSHANGRWYVDLVQYPFHFHWIQRVTGIPIAEKLICHLLQQT